MLTFPVILLHLFSFQVPETQRLINTTLEMLPKESFRLRFKIGKEDITWNRAINQDNDFTWIFMNEFNTSLYPSANQKAVFNSGMIYEDSLTFINDNSTIIPQFPFYVINNASLLQLLHLGDFGFAFKFANESNSIVHQLVSHNYIDHLSYSFVPSMNNGTHYIYFGGIPSQIKQNVKRGICHVNNNQTRWECLIKKITIGAFSYQITTPMYFQAGEEPLYAPRVFMSKLMNYVFQKLLNDQICSIVLLAKRDTIKCLTDKVKSFPMIDFTIESYIYSFNFSDFFENEGKYSYLNIMSNPYSNDTWVFGSSFLRHFSVLFDYEGKYVELFSDTRIARIRIEMMIMYYTIGGINGVGLLLLFTFRIVFTKDLKG